jgi:hypothetical protein
MMGQFHKFHSSLPQFGSTSTAFPATHNNTLLPLPTGNAFQLVTAHIGIKDVKPPKYVNKNHESNLYLGGIKYAGYINSELIDSDNKVSVVETIISFMKVILL